MNPSPFGRRWRAAPDEGGMAQNKTTRTTIERARALRRTATEPERFLWALLRGRRLSGWKFRRQVPIGMYIADFYCHEAGVVVEVDGAMHGEQLGYDDRRTAWLNAQGLRVLRFSTPQVLGSAERVLEAVLSACQEAPSSAAPRHLLPEGEGNTHPVF
jgi:very-short-patch-repair endonuclease